MASFFGIIGGILTTIRLIPQTAKSLKTRKTEDLSSAFVVILFFQVLFMILYGIFKPDYLIIYMNLIPLICSIVLWVLKVKNKRVKII